MISFVRNDHGLMIIIIFSLSTLAYQMGLLCGYKTNIQFPLLAEVFRISIIVKINASSLEKATSGSYAAVVSHFLAL